MEEEREWLVKIIDAGFIDVLEHDFMSTDCFRNPEYKNSSKSVIRVITEGREILNHPEISFETLELVRAKFSDAIAAAETDSELLSEVFGCRGTVLYKMKHYSDCLRDMNAALKLTNNTDLIALLSKYRTKCLEKLKDVVNEEEIIDEGIDESKYNPFKSVSIKYDDVNGRHLVASRDIKVGEILFIEKPYVQVINVEKKQFQCANCFKVDLAPTPCNECSWLMYCSESCRIEDFNCYHKYECKILHYIKVVSIKLRFIFNHLTLRFLIKTCNEFGTIQNLRKEVMAVENCKDKLTKGFSNRNKFDNKLFRSIFSLSYNVPRVNLDILLKSTVTIFYFIAKIVKNFFGINFEDIDINDKEELKNNEDAMFLLCFILRLSKIVNINRKHITANVLKTQTTEDEDEEKCKVIKSQKFDGYKYTQCERGECVTVLGSLINNSCAPNVHVCYTKYRNTCIYYALQPIPRKAQIFINYTGFYHTVEKSKRQDMLKTLYCFTCRCIACSNNWPSVKEARQFYKGRKKTKIELDIFGEVKEILVDSKAKDYTPDDETFFKLSILLTKAFKNTPAPSPLCNLIIDAFIILMDKKYGINFRPVLKESDLMNIS